LVSEKVRSFAKGDIRVIAKKCAVRKGHDMTMQGKIFLHPDLRNIVIPYAMDWAITRSCNLRCGYCTQSHAPYREIDYELVLKKIIGIAPKHIWIGGGEPAVVPQLPLITKILQQNLNAYLVVNTNMTNPDRIQEIVPFVSCLIISLDTIDPVISRKTRGVEPNSIIDGIERIVREKNRHHYRCDIVVHSVVSRDTIEERGVEKLNDRLDGIDKNILHDFTPLLPKTSEDSLINNESATAVFFAAFRRLKEKQRKVRSLFPVRADKDAFVDQGIACYRRYFRCALVEDGDFYSPCPSADILNPLCKRPCHCTESLNKLVNFDDDAMIKQAQFRGRFAAGEIERLKEFHHNYLKKEFPDSRYGYLLEHR
jgi:organic radical activating enzyme